MSFRKIINGSAVNKGGTTSADVSTIVDATIAQLIDSAPSTLDTLNELAAALNDDANFAATVTSQLNNAVVSSTTVSSDLNLSKGKYFVDTSSVRQLQLPASPSLGDEIQIFDATNNAGTKLIAVGNNGNKINGVLDSAEIDVNRAAAVFVWTGSTYGWRMG